MQTRKIDAGALETLMAAAVAAPSIHNTQPWRTGPRVASPGLAAGALVTSHSPGHRGRKSRIDFTQ
ncbi:hypothetical protein GCM10010300_82830 [Streptomyces olivaceoviridis]|uniref:hypothetical protein n=1 Tax=Streptomyces olivaceoviridis TaxID=1921 RepID=UPI0019AB3BD1|nr:hypothetical protein GCM10010300_82830 [Streptomyces olivaceoviridis]